MWRRFYKKALKRRIFAGTTAADESHLAKSAIVFAPHPDDETLACGGTIIRKTQLGAKVGLVFMTDGAGSHQRLMPREKMKGTRRREANEAAALLGVKPVDVHFLDFEDGQLARSTGEATQKIMDLLKLFAPEQVFVPFHEEPPSDHAATAQIIAAAREAVARSAEIWHYPVWLWHHYPWVPSSGSIAERLKFINSSRRVNKLLSNSLNFRVAIGDYSTQKREALEKHRSQMFRFENRSDWTILADIAQGEFLNRFFDDYEYFQMKTTN